MICRVARGLIAAGELDVARQQRVHARGLVRDAEKLDLVEIGLAGLPVVLVAHTDRAHAGREFLALYGPVPIAVVKSVVPSLTIRKWKVPSTTGKSAFGADSVICTSFGPVALTSCICAASVLAMEPTFGILMAQQRIDHVGRGQRLAVMEGARPGAA